MCELSIGECVRMCTLTHGMFHAFPLCAADIANER